VTLNDGGLAFLVPLLVQACTEGFLCWLQKNRLSTIWHTMLYLLSFIVRHCQ